METKIFDREQRKSEKYRSLQLQQARKSVALANKDNLFEMR
ncbi:MAG: hypothetical protein ABIC04_07310 [Nanoarchaeota archaeon]